MKLNKKVKDKWVKALRSGEYQQGSGKLKTKYSNNDFEYCCLGVACEIGITEPGRSDDTRNEFVKLDFLPIETQQILAEKNDARVSFKLIADWIEKNL